MIEPVLSTHRRVPDVVHHELDFLPVGVRPLVGGVHQAAEQLLVVCDHVEVELPSANIFSCEHHHHHHYHHYHHHLWHYEDILCRDHQ